MMNAGWLTMVVVAVQMLLISPALAVPPPPPANARATPALVCQPGQAVTLSADVPFGTTITWYAGGCGGTFAGLGPAALVFPTTTTTYFARASRLFEDSVTCAVVTVVVSSPPVAPASINVTPSRPCRLGEFTAEVVGGSGTTVRWYQDICGAGAPFEIGTGTRITHELEFPGWIYARWENECGVSQCTERYVNVLLPPYITGSSGGPNPAYVGEPLVYWVNLAGGSSSGVTFRWYKNGVLLPNFTGAGITIDPVRMSDAGHYYVVAENACGSATNDLYLGVRCRADFNNDGTFDFFDYLDFAFAFSLEWTTADVNSDGTVDFFDYLDFVEDYDFGCD
ncbi:MAG: hypothetical protein SFZ23_04735 [Planctomycetota bacterium]|nr:hypothetical protein [Planctomycetota bacterium]